MATKTASKLCRSAFSINSGNCLRLWSRLLRFQANNQLLRSHGGLRIFSRGICLYQASQVKKSETEWRKKLTPEQFWVCRQKGTEPPWSGEYVELKSKGIYKCVCCGSDLFSSSAKFDSGTGWPSFHSVIQTVPSDGQSSQLSVAEKRDDSHGMVRIEVLCRQCDSHLGHVFPDGPQPTGLRYCINSISLQFQPEDKDTQS